MNNFSIADELDQAVDNVLAGVETAGVNTDLELGELAGIAGELRMLPQAEFKASLKADLLGQTVSGSVEKLGTHAIQFAPRAHREIVPNEILSSLFGSNASGYPLHQRSMAASLFMHVTALALVVVSAVWANHYPVPKPTVTTSILSLADYPLPSATSDAHGGGGGGDHDKLKASAGAPPKFSLEQLAPPQVVVRNEHPKLEADPTVLGPPNVTFPQIQTGDLFSKLITPSNGAGIGGGIGEGRGTGVGIGIGGGVGTGYDAGIGGGLYSPGGGVSAPRPIYDPEPEYSDEARRAKFQGDVLLWVVIGPDGVPRDVRVRRSLGMGLDEKAIAAVKTWRFEPSRKDGRAVAVQVGIEVNFRLF